MHLPAAVSIREVGPRDGLQNEAPVPVADRVRLVDALSATGLSRVEVGAFVHPDAVPAMAGTEDVFAAITRRPGVVYSALVPNTRGVERALAASPAEVEVVVSASDTHNRRNVRRSTEESLAALADVVGVAKAGGVAVQGIIATSFGCPYEGDVAPERVGDVARRMLETGCDSLCLGDTTGMATPLRVEAVLAGLPDAPLTLHFHNTRGTGLANLLCALQAGVTSFDASVGGLGGCPYAPGATGNICTEDAVHMLEDMGVHTGVGADALVRCALLAQEIVGRTLPGQVMVAGPRSATVTP